MFSMLICCIPETNGFFVQKRSSNSGSKYHSNSYNKQYSYPNGISTLLYYVYTIYYILIYYVTYTAQYTLSIVHCIYYLLHMQSVRCGMISVVQDTCGQSYSPQHAVCGMVCAVYSTWCGISYTVCSTEYIVYSMIYTVYMYTIYHMLHTLYYVL